MRDGSLICPGCGTEHPAAERFCEACGLPLIHAGGGETAEKAGPRGALARAARKIDPRYAEGDPVKVLSVRNQTEAELIQGLLLEEGIPSLLRQDSSRFMPFGGSDVYVPAAALQAAREVLLRGQESEAD